MVYNYHNTYEYYRNKRKLQKLVFISLEMVEVNTAGKHLLMPNC
jgi:hypothetical protein